MQIIKTICKMIAAIVIMNVLIISLESEVIRVTEQRKYSKVRISDDEFRADFFSENQLNKKHLFSEECKTILNNVEKEVSYYPVAKSNVDKTLHTDFINSWMSERNFGGKRGHEGTDIMSSKNIRGVFPIVSMTDGIITKLGWLEKGGYRVGVTSDSGIYYYYAHLDSYSNIREGQRIKAGELLGFMGDSGYGTEGTRGKFDVHLHVGIYLYINGEELSVNPYFVLRSIKKYITFS